MIHTNPSDQYIDATHCGSKRTDSHSIDESCRNVSWLQTKFSRIVEGITCLEGHQTRSCHDNGVILAVLDGDPLPKQLFAGHGRDTETRCWSCFELKLGPF